MSVLIVLSVLLLSSVSLYGCTGFKHLSVEVFALLPVGVLSVMLL